MVSFGVELLNNESSRPRGPRLHNGSLWPPTGIFMSRSRAALLTILALLLVAVACTRSISRPVAVYSAGSVGTDSAPAASNRVLLAGWTGSYGGVPAFDKVAV